eukprot:TRINITY_DN1978_c0_g2_i1.p1 TRINITY_DN1978_c0_g2~~TRINITY_DN1978_c0_g2_i1.p1  ORF type:complete len:210 (-),score=62.85 TRINITY_DN1978_c0_g2_i1:16-645(-)
MQNQPLRPIQPNDNQRPSGYYMQRGDDDQSLFHLNNQLRTLQEENQRLKSKRDQNILFVQSNPNLDAMKDLADFRAFAMTNFQKFEELIDELYRLKDACDIERNAKAELQRKYEEMKVQVRNFSTEAGTNERTNAVLQTKEWQTAVDKASKEVDELTQKHDRYLKQSTNKDFFKEYDISTKEVEALRKQNMSLNEELKRLQRELDGAKK